MAGIPIIGDVIGSIFGKVGDIVGKAVVDKDKRIQAQTDLARLQMEGIQAVQAAVHNEIMGQLEINKEEAKHGSIFVAGWRPAVGWVSATGLAYAVVLQPILSWASRVIWGYEGLLPEIDTSVLLFALGGMLGIGSMRTIEKVKGVSTNVMADSPAASRNVPVSAYAGSTDHLPEDAPWSRA